MITREEYEANKVVLEGAPKCGKATQWSLENGYWMIRADGAWLWADAKFIPYTSAGIYFRSLDDLRKINAAYEREQWISVKDRLPEHSGRFLVYVAENRDLGKSKFVWNCCFLKKENNFQLDVTFKGDEQVTHWMPLPQTPQGGE